ncbi:MAG: type II toxin-antitoxin system mRNA interferase toxin, RelE/StbE family [Syntrophobacteraceae bacterium]
MKDVAEVRKDDRRRIVDAIEKLVADPLKGRPLKGRWKGLRRIRVGLYRVIYVLRRSELTVLVLRIGHRREVYR